MEGSLPLPVLLISFWSSHSDPLGGVFARRGWGLVLLLGMKILLGVASESASFLAAQIQQLANLLASQSDSSTVPYANVVSSNPYGPTKPWISDNRATDHITCNLGSMIDISLNPSTPPVQIPNGDCIPVSFLD
ncbi:unnamed protein product [Dovyalis caffra]|uniref:Uncharacterized protein n=1 Tax=Dovyalis caffra TaxID=77055 RepID=A0AAV1RPN5_9ROSI|nr:unnamed protein product [Dovyalis caffra]